MKFNDLSIQEKAAVIKLGVGGGLHTLLDIALFWDGMPDDPPGYYEQMEKVANENYHKWGYNNPDEALVHALNDNTYDYRGFYRDNPNARNNAETHWPDTYKTVYHPTFSNESKYSGVIDRNFNPEGRIGGYWQGEDFIPAEWQNEYKKGGSIHIKPENRGKFNATKKRTGKTTEELTHSKNPLTRKRAIFALNARKWHHKHPDGGSLIQTNIGPEWNMPDYFAQSLILGPMYGFGYIPPRQLDHDDLRNRQLYLESEGDIKAGSNKGAAGLFQIMPNTLQWYQDSTGHIGDVFDPVYNESVRNWALQKNYNSDWAKYGNPTDEGRWARAYAAYNYGASNLGKAIKKAEREGIDVVNGDGWMTYLPDETRNYVNFLFNDVDASKYKTLEKYQEWVGNGNKHIRAYGGPDDPPKRRFRDPLEILAEKYGIVPVVADNTNIVLNPVYTPQEKSYAAALLAFYKRHKSPEAEEKALSNARLAVKDLKYAELSRTGQINNTDLDNRTWLSKNWPQAKRWIDNKFSLIGDLSDATNGVVDLKYFIPGVGQAVLVGDMAENLDNGNVGNAFVDGLFAFAPGYKNIENAGSQIANWWVKPHGFAGSYELRFNNVFSPSYWKEVRSPESYQDAVNQVKNFHDEYRVRKLGKISDDIIDKRNPLVELFYDPFRFDYSYENIKMPIIKTGRHGNIKSIKFDKKQQNLFNKNPIGKTEIRPMGPFRYIKENGLKGFLESTGVNHQGNLFDLNLFHPNIIGMNPKVLKGIASHEMLHTAQTMIKAPYLNLSMPYNGYFGPNIFFKTFRPDVRFDAMNASDPQPDFIDRLIRFKDNAKSILGGNGLINKTPLKSRKSNQWFRSPDELDAEMANFRYLYNINVPLRKMPTDLLNKAIDVMSRRFKVSSRDDMGNLMMQLSDIGYFSKGGPIKPFSYLPIPEVRY